MNVRAAIDDTMQIARSDWMKVVQSSDNLNISDDLKMPHLEEMYNEVARTQGTDAMSYGKLCRWLGWMQGAVCAWGYSDVETFKEVNRRYAD